MLSICVERQFYGRPLPDTLNKHLSPAISHRAAVAPAFTDAVSCAQAHIGMREGVMMISHLP
ncbi:hypothetical protein ACTXT7_012808 [Hymenolepis weldensis]